MCWSIRYPEDGELERRHPAEAVFIGPIHFGAEDGLLLLDQIRAIDRQRLIRRLGGSTDQPLHQTLDRLRQVFGD